MSTKRTLQKTEYGGKALCIHCIIGIVSYFVRRFSCSLGAHDEHKDANIHTQLLAMPTEYEIFSIQFGRDLAPSAHNGHNWPQCRLKGQTTPTFFFSCRPHLQQKVALYWVFPGKWMSKPLTHSSFSLTLLVFNLCSGWAPKMLIDFQQVADVMVITSAAADLFAGIRTFTKSILLDAHHNRSGGAKYGNCDIFSFLVKLTTSQNGNDSIVVRLGIAIQKRSDEWMKTEVTFKEPEVIDKHRTKVNETDQRGRAQKNRFWLRQILCISVYICRDENAFENGPMHFHLHVPLFQAFKSVCIFISQFTSSGA